MATLNGLIPGQEYVRRELHKEFGGNQQKGIVTLPKFEAIFLLNSSKGSDYGYMILGQRAYTHCQEREQ